VLTIAEATAHASALVKGCSKTDLRLTLAAYRHTASSFVLLAAVTLQPVSDGPTSQVLELPACSTDVVLIRGSAPTTASSFTALLGSTTAPGCGETNPSQNAGDPQKPQPSTDTSSGGKSGGASGGQPPTEPEAPPTEGTGDSGASQQPDAGSSDHESTGDAGSVSGTQGVTSTSAGTTGGSAGGDKSHPTASITQRRGSFRDASHGRAQRR
jgi:hypothetical protein